MTYKFITIPALSIIICALVASCSDRNTQGNMDVQGKIVISTHNELRISDTPFIRAEKPLWKVIAENDDTYRYPEWAPDGMKIVMSYLSWDERKPTVREKNTYYLIRINADGTGKNILLKGNENYEYPSWSPDGKTIAFVAYPNWPQERVGQVRLLELSTKKIKEVNKFTVHVARPNWSYNGEMLTFATSEMSIALYDLITGKSKILANAGLSPILHPDGSKIFYVLEDHSALCSINIDGTNKKIVKKGFIDYLIKFSGDGKYLLFAGGGTTLFLPGHEYSTLEFMDMQTLKTVRVFKGRGLYGASWVEK